LRTIYKDTGKKKKLKKTTYLYNNLTFLTSNMSLVDIRTVTITEKGQIAIPKELRKISGFKTGNKITILAFKDHIELRTMKEFNKRMETALASEQSLAKDWDTPAEDEAWKDL
jgi:AbrB family looped-hinge helix DNA binding protein